MDELFGDRPHSAAPDATGDATPDATGDVVGDALGDSASGSVEPPRDRAEVVDDPTGPPAEVVRDRADDDVVAASVTSTTVEHAVATPDPDATAVMPLAGLERLGARSDRSGDVWDTATIRRWDPTMSDRTGRLADSAMDRPRPLEDRAELDVQRPDEPQAGRWYEIPLMILTALTLAFLLRTFVVQVFYIPSGSMIPTMEVNDRIAVEKLSYLVREPARGEVVVFAGDDPFADPTVASTADRVLTGVGQFLGVVPVDAKDFVKRVIGLPGDTVTLDNGVVSVNGVELDEPYADLDRDNGQWTVPAGELFVMGDNRGNSGDSRSSLGFVPTDDVVGRAVVTLWPFDRAGSIPGEDHDAAVDAGS